MNFLLLHFSAIKFSIAKSVSDPINFILNIIVFGIAFSLPLSAILVLQNSKDWSKNDNFNSELTVFLKMDINDQNIKNIQKKLKSEPNVRSISFVHRDDAFNKFKSEMNVDNIFGKNEVNPLPHAFIIKLDNTSKENLLNIQKRINTFIQVDKITSNADSIEKINNFINLLVIFAFFIFILISLSLISVIYNTIRLQVLSKKDQLEISKLIGATNAFIRRPFIYFGGLQAIMGGIFSIISTNCLFILINFLISKYLNLANFSFNLLNLETIVIFLISSFLLGLLGSYFSVNKYLSELE